MKSFGDGPYKVLVTMKNGKNEMHYFMTTRSRERFLSSNRKNKTILRMYLEDDK